MIQLGKLYRDKRYSDHVIVVPLRFEELLYNGTEERYVIYQQIDRMENEEEEITTIYASVVWEELN